MHVEGKKKEAFEYLCSLSLWYSCVFSFAVTKIGYEWFDYVKLIDWKWAKCKMIYVLVHSSERKWNKVNTMLSIADHGK